MSGPPPSNDDRALEVGGPYRAATMALEPLPPPRGFFVRMLDGELVIEQRWRMNGPAWIGVGMAAAMVILPWLVGPVDFLRALWPLVAAFNALSLATVGALFARKWFRTTLVLGAGEASLARRNAFGVRRLRGPLSELSLVEIKRSARLADEVSAYAIELSVGGALTTAFRHDHRNELYQVVDLIAAWKRAHETEVA